MVKHMYESLWLPATRAPRMLGIFTQIPGLALIMQVDESATMTQACEVSVRHTIIQGG
jgi:hypothetical protein